MNYSFNGTVIEREKKFTGDRQIKAIAKKLIEGAMRKEMKKNA